MSTALRAETAQVLRITLPPKMRRVQKKELQARLRVLGFQWAEPLTWVGPESAEARAIAQQVSPAVPAPKEVAGSKPHRVPPTKKTKGN